MSSDCQSYMARRKGIALAGTAANLARSRPLANGVAKPYLKGGCVRRNTQDRLIARSIFHHPILSDEVHVERQDRVLCPESNDLAFENTKIMQGSTATDRRNISFFSPLQASQSSRRRSGPQHRYRPSR
jgi:hypothetical protein